MKRIFASAIGFAVLGAAIGIITTPLQALLTIGAFLLGAWLKSKTHET